MAPTRPNFNQSTAELEQLFQQHRNDRAVLEDIHHELGFRTRPAALALRDEIRAALAALRNQQPGDLFDGEHPTPTPPKPPVTPSPPISPKPPVDPAPPQPPEPPADDNNSWPPLPPKPPRSPGSGEGDAIQAAQVVSAWIALEALEPRTFRHEQELVENSWDIVPLRETNLPWQQAARSRPGAQLYYEVPLAIVDMEVAGAALVARYGGGEEYGGFRSGRALVSTIVLDRQGIPLEEEGLAVASFAWALPRALDGDLDGLGSWPLAERQLLDGLEKLLLARANDGAVAPLDHSRIDRARRWLLAALKLDPAMVEPASFVMRRYQQIGKPGGPSPSLLNSFYLRDLCRAASALEQSGRPLQQYLGLQPPPRGADLLKHAGAVAALVAPGKFPAAQWPSRGGHTLVTLQQAAVNAAWDALGNGGKGVIAVNGPPGTGKTTLLRDLVAANVTARALAMCSFKDPKEAFSATGARMMVGGNAFLHLYQLDERLRGHEMVVASSNNKAVENISRELPQATAIADGIGHFRFIAQAVADAAEEAEAAPVWGLIAAALGNGGNRSRFFKAFWWDDEAGMRAFLLAAQGREVSVELKDADGKVIGKRLPAFMESDPPLAEPVQRAAWQRERKAFIERHARIQSRLQDLETLRLAMQELSDLKAATADLESTLVVACQDVEQATGQFDACQLQVARADALVVTAARGHEQILSQRPAWWSRLFGTQAWQHWQQQEQESAGKRRQTIAELENAQRSQTASVATLETTKARFSEAEQALRAHRDRVQLLEREIAAKSAGVGERVVNGGYFDKGHEHWNLQTPWLDEVLQVEREDLFADALRIHRLFIEINAQRIAHNVGALQGILLGKGKKDLHQWLPQLWSTFFTTVPVVSTTFASVETMLGPLPAGSLGWALIDEAGQATPQSAVGLLMRCQRAVVVGDPLQIPPVVTLPEKLGEQVSLSLGVDPERWCGPKASVQTLADAVSPHRAVFAADIGEREVGLPLLVHRRCQEPMFSISNALAYNNQMVLGFNSKDGGMIGEVLGESGWFDVAGASQGKWSEEEGRCLIRLLQQLADAGLRNPDIYVITPFRNVAHALRQLLARNPVLFRQLGADIDEWKANRVGTIHTFQGKEAEVVIAMLGAPADNERGARQWATSEPNILNVMVSRAKKRFYVIGSRAAWGGMGYARVLTQYVPVK